MSRTEGVLPVDGNTQNFQKAGQSNQHDIRYNKCLGLITYAKYPNRELLSGAS